MADNCQMNSTLYREVRFITSSFNCEPKGCPLRALRFATAGRRARNDETKFCYVESSIIHVAKAQKGGSIRWFSIGSMDDEEGR